MTQYSGKVIRKTPVTPTQTSASGVWKLNEQAAAIRNNSWPVPGVPDPISRSVRLRSSASAYFNRTPASVSNQKTWTWSAWVKRGTLGSIQTMLSGGGASTDYTDLRFNASDVIYFTVYSASTQVALLTSSLVCRDPSAWYHIVLAYDSTQATSSNRIKIYLNGVQVTSFGTSTYPSLNQNANGINGSTAMNLGRTNQSSSNYFDGYMTEVNFIDGQALTPSSFGTTDTATGAWIPMPYTGTYGTNGFYLNFKDNTSTTTLGYDYSGNANNWTTNNISLTSGSTYDSMLDVPTPWIGYNTDGGVSVTRGNYCTLNPLDLGTSASATLSNANLTLTTNNAGFGVTRGTFGVSSGKWYWEVTAVSSSTNNYEIGIATATATTTGYLGSDANGWSYYGNNGSKYNNGSGSAYGATYTVGDVIGVALDMDAGTLTYYKNGASQGQAFSGITGTIFPAASDGSGTVNAAMSFNFGQQPFAQSVPTGFKTFCTTNLPTPTITNGANYMAASTYTGTGATQSIVNSGNNTAAISFQPDFVWIKSRSAATDHKLTDSVRGVTKALISDTAGAETTDANGLTVFGSSGFTVGTDTNYNNNTATYVAWQWRANGIPAVTNTSGSITSTVSANTTAGFSVVTYTGTGANATVGHGLGVAPSMMIVKNRSASSTSWIVYHTSLGATTAVYLDTTGASAPSSLYWNNTAPTSSVFTVGAYGPTNGSTNNIVAYCWAQVAGFSKFGSYTGNGSADGPFVYCGFRPRFVMIKGISGVSVWYTYDSSRDTYNATINGLFPNSASAEGGTTGIDITSNGFKLRTTATDLNTSGNTMIFMAFSENSFKYSNAR